MTPDQRWFTIFAITYHDGHGWIVGKSRLPLEIEAHLSVSAEELRTVLTEPDLASARHHDLESIMNAFLKAEGIKVTELPEELLPLQGGRCPHT